jgi:hypothetical protein
MPNPWDTLLPYEAQIYEQLAGSRAIPSVHWSGMYGDADVIVMDYLGPTLEHVRRACRGSLTLKSVLMIGLQIVGLFQSA